MSDFIQRSGSGSGDTPPPAWTQARLDAYSTYLREHYPELAAALAESRLPGEPKVEMNAFTGTPTEAEIAMGALDAIYEDYREGMQCMFKDRSAAWDEGVAFMRNASQYRAFTFGLWLGELGLLRVKKPKR